MTLVLASCIILDLTICMDKMGGDHTLMQFIYSLFNLFPMVSGAGNNALEELCVISRPPNEETKLLSAMNQSAILDRMEKSPETHAYASPHFPALQDAVHPVQDSSGASLDGEIIILIARNWKSESPELTLVRSWLLPHVAPLPHLDVEVHTFVLCKVTNWNETLPSSYWWAGTVVGYDENNIIFTLTRPLPSTKEAKHVENDEIETKFDAEDEGIDGAMAFGM